MRVICATADMLIKISKNGYKQKPTAENMKSISWSIKNNKHVKVDYFTLKKYLERGHSVLLAEFEEIGNIQEDNIKELCCIALDIDSKENEVTTPKMIELIKNEYNITPVLYYNTFSDKDDTKFRLIYEIEGSIDVEVYKTFYKALVWKFNKYLDSQTVNANRIWAGTNKKVFYDEKAIPISFNLLIKLINSYNAKLLRDKKNIKKNTHGKSVKLTNSHTRFNLNNIDGLVNYLIENIDLKDYIIKHFGGTFKRNGGLHAGCCCLHGGDNPNALVIYDKSYRCYTKCGSGNIITIAKKVYNTDSFLVVAEQLIKELNLNVPNEFLRRY